jgi:Zn-dependent protease
MSFDPFGGRHVPLMDRDLHHVGPPRISFSATEVLHLAVSVVVLSYAFSILFVSDPGGGTGVPTLKALIPEPLALLSAFVAVASGFVLHELAHKIVAQRYGHWAEFRAHFPGLGISVLIAAFFHFLFAAPGAVIIQGRVTPRENGLISLVGPGTNFIVALVCLPFFAFKVNADFTTTLFGTVAGINALLAVFNLLPFGPFDGRKVLRWNAPVYAVAAVLAVALFVFCITQGALP